MWRERLWFYKRGLGEGVLAELSNAIMLRYTEVFWGPCIKDHHPGVGGEDIVPSIRAKKEKNMLRFLPFPVSSLEWNIEHNPKHFCIH